MACKTLSLLVLILFTFSLSSCRKFPVDPVDPPITDLNGAWIYQGKGTVHQGILERSGGFFERVVFENGSFQRSIYGSLPEPVFTSSGSYTVQRTNENSRILMIYYKGNLIAGEDADPNTTGTLAVVAGSDGNIMLYQPFLATVDPPAYFYQRFLECGNSPEE